MFFTTAMHEKQKTGICAHESADFKSFTDQKISNCLCNEPHPVLIRTRSLHMEEKEVRVRGWYQGCGALYYYTHDLLPLMVKFIQHIVKKEPAKYNSRKVYTVGQYSGYHKTTVLVLLKWPAGICLVNLTTNYKQNKLLAYQYNGCSRKVKVSTTVLKYNCYISMQGH